MGKKIARLSPDEVKLLVAGQENPDLLSNYFFKRPGADHGWVLDDNFDPEGAWQKAMHFASQSRIIVIGGFGSGKTRGVGISACMWSMTTHDFAFMNCAPTQYQSRLMYNFILEVSRGTRFADLIYKAPSSPYPQIDIRFWAGEVLIISKLEFMSIDRNAVQILSWEGDWVNIDEGGQIDTLDDVIINLGSRLRGSINGRSRLGRLSITSNSWDNPELWSRYDMAVESPEDYLSMTVSSRHNHNITPSQLKMMLKDIPEDEHERFIDGSRPEGKGSYFNKQKVFACEDPVSGEITQKAAEQGIPGYIYVPLRGSGVIHYEIPPAQERQYVVTGDPGWGNVPLRNAPVVMVWDVTSFPTKPTNIVGFWWGAGNGSTIPFIRQVLRYMVKYNPLMTCVDSTATQAHTAEVLNTYLYSARETGKFNIDWVGESLDMSHVMNPWFEGMDFAGAKKPAYLVSARLMIEAGLVKWPKVLSGIRRQLTNYDPEKDKTTSYLAQDIVASFAMGAYAIRVLFNVSPDELAQRSGEETHPMAVAEIGGTLRLPQAARTQRDSQNTRSKPEFEGFSDISRH